MDGFMPVDAHAPGSPGSVSLIIGPMFSGKTTELVRRVRVALAARRRCCVVRPDRDSRWAGGDLHTHHSAGGGSAVVPDGCRGFRHDEAPIVSVSSLVDAADRLAGYDVVGVDEGQFFEDLAAGCDALASRGVHVIVAALNGTYARTPFPAVSELYPVCERVSMLHAVCMVCRERNAPFSVLCPAGPAPGNNGTPHSSDFVNIGGEDKYRAVCRACLP